MRRHLNIKGLERVDYVAYLKKCTDVLSAPLSVASTARYQQYLRELERYWLDFVRRTQACIRADPQRYTHLRCTSPPHAAAPNSRLPSR